MKDKIKEILVDVYGIDGRHEDEATERILRLFNVVGQSEQLHKLLQYLSDEDELVGNRTHQEIIDSFNQLV